MSPRWLFLMELFRRLPWKKTKPYRNDLITSNHLFPSITWKRGLVSHSKFTRLCFLVINDSLAVFMTALLGYGIQKGREWRKTTLWGLNNSLGWLYSRQLRKTGLPTTWGELTGCRKLPSHPEKGCCHKRNLPTKLEDRIQVWKYGFSWRCWSLTQYFNPERGFSKPAWLRYWVGKV